MTPDEFAALQAMHDQLAAQSAQVAAQIAAAKTEAKAGAIAQVKATMAQHGLTVADVCGTLSAVKRVGKPTGKVAVKFRNSAGDTWTGRGMKPVWMRDALAAGANIDDFKAAA